LTPADQSNIQSVGLCLFWLHPRNFIADPMQGKAGKETAPDEEYVQHNTPPSDG
jgi:hypothetical protein